MTKLRHSKTAAFGILLCLFAVAIGAFGSHALSDLLLANQRQSVFELANRYQFYHGLALIAVAALFQNAETPNRALNVITFLMVSGVILFSGSLYALALSNISILGAVTPVGGILLILSWAIMAWEVIMSKSSCG